MIFTILLFWLIGIVGAMVIHNTNPQPNNQKNKNTKSKKGDKNA